MEHNIPMKYWGKDHASMLAYVECCCVEYEGLIDGNRVRVNPDRHPVFGDQGIKFRFGRTSKWNVDYRTQAKQGSNVPEYHDDVDVLDELEEQGFVEMTGTMVNPYYKMTKKGFKVVSKIREHKTNGGNFAGFDWTPWIKKEG